MSDKGRSSDGDQSNTSGTGRSSGGRHCKSRKKQSSESSNDNNTSSQKKMTEQRFAPEQKAHSVTCNQSKDHLIPQMQWTCDHGLDTADSLG